MDEYFNAYLAAAVGMSFGGVLAVGGPFVPAGIYPWIRHRRETTTGIGLGMERSLLPAAWMPFCAARGAAMVDLAGWNGAFPAISP